MNFLLLSIFINFALGSTDYNIPLSSSIYKNGKMYIYDPHEKNALTASLYVYNLKDGLISDLKPNIVNITNANYTYTPQFLNIPPGLPNGRSDQLWMMGALYEQELMNNDIDEESWTSQILNDKELRFDSSFIAKPSYKNFPESAFSITIVNNNNNPILYVIGGLLYSKKLKTQLITNYQFKYEFKTNTWSDLSQNTKSILQPVAYHKVIQADNSLILVSGATQNYTKNGNFTNTVPADNSIHLMISDIYKFDLSTEKWSLVNTKLNLGEEKYGRGQAEGLSLDIYNEKLISYMVLKDMSSGKYIPKLATLDYKAKDWSWTWLDFNSDTDVNNSLVLYDYRTLIINDQLLLFHGSTNQDELKVYAIGLITNKMQDFMNISGKYGQYTGSGLQTWEIILMSVICVVGVIIILCALWSCCCHNRQIKPAEANRQKMKEVRTASNIETSINYNRNDD